MTALRALAHERQNERTGQQWHAAGGKAQDSTARSRRHRLGCRRLTRVRLLHLSHAGPDLDVSRKSATEEKGRRGWSPVPRIWA